MNLQQYIDSKKSGKAKAAIAERWQIRIVARGLEQLPGEQGAQSYLRDYGKSIAAPKCIDLGNYALSRGYPGMASGFFRRAAELEGVVLEGNGEVLVAETPKA